jgi:vancomycin permeability regulator SanA
MPNSNDVATRNEVALPSVHPTISREMGLLDRSIAMAEQAATAITTGAMPAKDCNVLLGSGRLFQSAARQSIVNRMQAARLAMQEAKLIEASA